MSRSLYKARARLILWRCPPLRLAPRSPIYRSPESTRKSPVQVQNDTQWLPQSLLLSSTQTSSFSSFPYLDGMPLYPLGPTPELGVSAQIASSSPTTIWLLTNPVSEPYHILWMPHYNPFSMGRITFPKHKADHLA